MRPRKKILLVCQSINAASVLSFKLDNWGYSVMSTSCSSNALTLLAAGSYQLLLCVLPLPGVERLIDQGHEIDDAMKSLILQKSHDALAGNLHADALMTEGDSMADLRDRVKRLTALRRGPRERKPIFPAAVLSREERRLA
jgi:CheY-like chemotaxis protein